MRREVARLAAHARDVFAQSRRQEAQLVLAFERKAPLKTQQQTQMEHLQRGKVNLSARAQGIEALEEMLPGQLVAEHPQLQRLLLPRFPYVQAGAQDDFVGSRAEGVLGGGHIVGSNAQRARLVVDLAKEAHHVHGKVGIALRFTPVPDQGKRVEAFVHQVGKAARCGCRLRCGRNAPLCVLSHGTLPINELRKSLA